MLKVIKKSLVIKLSVLFVLSVIISAGSIAYMGYELAKEAVIKGEFDKLTAIREAKGKAVLDFYETKLAQLESLAVDPTVIEAMVKFDAMYDKVGKELKGKNNGQFDAPDEYKVLHNEYIEFFETFIEKNKYYDLFLMSPDYGDISFTVTKEGDFGQRAKNIPSSLKDAWSKVSEDGDKATSLSDTKSYSPSNNIPAQFIAAPIIKDGNKIGVLAIQISLDAVNDIMEATKEQGLGESGETYIVGEDFLMRSKARLGAGEDAILKTKVETTATKSALDDTKGKGIIEDYRGNKVLSAYRNLGLKKELGTDFNWCIIAEVDEKEALKPVIDMKNLMILISIGIAIIIGAIGVFFAISISKPISQLSVTAEKVANGDLSVDVQESSSSDEVGILIRTFAKMISNLREQTTQIKDTSTLVAATSAELSTTASQLAANSAETSTSVTEITTTVEEVRQTSQVSNTKANEVAQQANEVAKISNEGKAATDNTSLGILRIKDEMESIAESIIKLSEQTQSIGEIIGVVNNLADQSNLLSVNASIEAAKAGEFGKGFAVVAQEVKTLADQSKEATKQVNTILNDIQKAARVAVQATKRGSGVVEEGVRLTSQAGNTIDALSRNVSEAATSATQISTSNQQQLIGMDQLVTAVSSVKEAARQNVDGATQLQMAITNLKNIGSDLNDLANKFTV